jgi:hypothetical protein
MRHRSLFFAGLSCALLLCGCVSREQADAKLAHACRAGVQSLLPEGLKIDRITGREFSKSPEGNDMRYVKISTVTIDKMLEEEKDYECIFEEQFALFGMDYTASVYQVRTGDKTYGKSGNDIMGDANDFLKLTDAIREALYDTTTYDDSVGADGKTGGAREADASETPGEEPAPASGDAPKEGAPVENSAE